MPKRPRVTLATVRRLTLAFPTDHYRGYPTVLVRLASVTRTELQGVLEQAWRLHAPRRLVSEYEQRRKH